MQTWRCWKLVMIVGKDVSWLPAACSFLKDLNCDNWSGKLCNRLPASTSSCIRSKHRHLVILQTRSTISARSKPRISIYLHISLYCSIILHVRNKQIWQGITLGVGKIIQGYCLLWSRASKKLIHGRFCIATHLKVLNLENFCRDVIQTQPTQI